VIDQFYTPPGLAALLVGSAKTRKAQLVADFAAGDGALLRAAQGRWGDARLFGSDIDPNALETISGLASPPVTSLYDFLSDDEPPAALHTLRGRCDVVLLNPPFTCRGNRRYPVSLKGEVHQGSKALVFVARALEYLKAKGELLAIVPASCLTSARDEGLLQALRRDYNVQQIGEINRNAFTGCSVSVVVVRIRSRRRVVPDFRPIATVMKPVIMKGFSAEILRGSLAVADAHRRPGLIPCIHTTDLRDGVLLAPSLKVMPQLRYVEGAVILIPRVGRPSLPKLVKTVVSESVLTDCVFALRTYPVGHEDQLYRLIRMNWAQVEKAYGGSCAPYLTRAGLQALLLKWGVASSIVSSMERLATEEQTSIPSDQYVARRSRLRAG